MENKHMLGPNVVLVMAQDNQYQARFLSWKKVVVDSSGHFFEYCGENHLSPGDVVIETLVAE